MLNAYRYAAIYSGLMLLSIDAVAQNFGQICHQAELEPTQFPHVHIVHHAGNSLRLDHRSRTRYGGVRASDIDPGDIVCIKPYAYKKIKIMNFDAARDGVDPITFVNYGGILKLQQNAYAAIIISNSFGIRVTGSGLHDPANPIDPNDPDFYGIQVLPEPYTDYDKGVRLERRSSHIELDHIKMVGTEAAVSTGYQSDCPGNVAPMKYTSDNDAVARSYFGDPLKYATDYRYDYTGDGSINADDETNSENTIQENISIHDLWIENPSQEAMYLGSNRIVNAYRWNNGGHSSDPFFKPGTGQGSRTYCYYQLLSDNSWVGEAHPDPLNDPYPNDPRNIRTDGLRIYRNIIKWVGRDAINIKSAAQNCEVFENLVMGDGAGDDAQQTGAYNAQTGTHCQVHHNVFMDGNGSGIRTYGTGNFYNNLLIRNGYRTIPPGGNQKSHTSAIELSAISENNFSTDVGDWQEVYDGKSMGIYNNTIISPRRYGIRHTNPYLIPAIKNNVVVNVSDPLPGVSQPYFYMDSDATAELSHNFESPLLLDPDIAFVNPVFDDYRLNSDSVLIDAGIELGLEFKDFDGTDRPQGAGIDIGAYEKQ